MLILVNSYVDYLMGKSMKSEYPDQDIDTLSREVNSISYYGQRSSAELEHMEAELRLTLEEIARLQNALAEANMKNTALQASIGSQNTKIEGAKIFKPVLEELRQPLHTIQGYLDLLSNESVGVLGAFQKRFIERITGSVEHMQALLLNLETESSDNEEQSQAFAKEFSITKVIEETLAIYTNMIRNKKITLLIEFENDEVQFYGDQETFERVLNILFTNACASLEEEGTLTLNLKILRGKRPAQVLFSIQASNHDSPKAKPLPVNLSEFKDIEIKLEGFGSPLRDLIKANTLVQDMHGKIEIFSIPSSGSLLRLKLPASS